MRYLPALLILTACTKPLFNQQQPEQTGITFANTITTDDSLNALTDPYVYNGAGVGIGDIDNDGLPDIFLAGNMVSSRLYRNKGNFRFEDITERAGVKTNRWVTGVTMVDINNDGHLDIYLSVSGPPWSKPEDRANLLFINNGDGTFTEQAAKYGIADTGYTTHAVFLDYDGDGCLDLFLLENSPQDFNRSESMGARRARGSYNQLYHNNCNGTFTNVSQQAGIMSDAGYGLGVAVADFNRDGRPDIYVSSDGEPNDMLFVNNGDGTFTNRAAQWLRHTSYAGMGVDAADVNNDGWPDIVQVDMMPQELDKQKRMSGFRTYGGVAEARRRGIRLDYDLNVLQLSAGIPDGHEIAFSDIGRMAGIAYTDWSWSALFADFDDDGWKDILITAGYPKAVNDFDYISAAFARKERGDTRSALQLLKVLTGYKLPNRVFRNNGGLTPTFTDETAAWGLDHPAYSFGAAYGDLNNDGRLDLVVNNIDSPAFIYKNVRPADDTHHWLELRLLGDTPNRGGIGATVTVTAGGRKQYLYHSPFRGYMSTMDDREHVGLGGAKRVDSVEVRWPDGRYQRLRNPGVDRLLTVRQADAKERRPPDQPALPPSRPFELLDAAHRPAYIHKLRAPIDYTVQPLLPYQPSSQGPPIAVADVNGDGLDDVYIGGGSGVPGKLFLQQKDGSFAESSLGQPWAADSAYDDWGALFFDANGDGLPDLYVASCNYRLVPGSPLLQDRLYINRGGGRFVRDTAALPPMRSCTGVVRAGDFTGHGRQDLFVGGRLTPRRYPWPTRSYLLRNDGGRFTDVTAQYAPQLVKRGGMITDAAFVDFDGDGRLDLVTAGEWMPLQFLHNDGGHFRDVTAETRLPRLRGWWYSLAVGDFDGDGRPDIIAGNLGLNHSYTTSAASPFGVWAGDFSGNGSADVVLTQELGGTEYPLAGLSPLGSEIEPAGRRFPTYASFARASLRDLFPPEQLRDALHYQVDTLASVYLHNDGAGRFTMSALPSAAQIAPARALVSYDVDGDGRLDLLVAGNLYDVEPNTARADAGNGLWLRGDGRGHFTPVPPMASGLFTPKNVAGLALIHTQAGEALLVANTGDSLQAFAIRKASTPTRPAVTSRGSASVAASRSRR